MAKIAKILPLPVEVRNGEMTTKNALAEKGYNRHPGTGVGFPPIKSKTSGKFLTGLDENAEYINLIANPVDREAEREKVKSRRERLELATGLDLGPKSEFYSGVYGPKYGTNEVANRCRLFDGENVFNFANALKEIEFWWVIQNTDLIASSLDRWKKSQCKPTVQFYVSNPEEEATAAYNENKAKVLAQKELDNMSIERRYKVATLLGLPVTENDKEEIIYNQIYNFVNSGEIKLGEYAGSRAVTIFNNITNLSDALVTTKALIREAIKFRIYHKDTSGIVYEGNTMVATSEDVLLKELSSTKAENQQKYLALEIKVEDKKKMRQSVN